MGKTKKTTCIGCGVDAETLSGWDNERYCLFPDTKYMLCYLCYDKIARRFGEKGLDEILNKESHCTKKKKIEHKLRQEVYERDKYRCVYCGDHKDLTLDHVVPESLGGGTNLENLVTCCRKCNCDKGVKTDWAR